MDVDSREELVYLMKDGRWICVFITYGEKDMFGDTIGNLYNLRRTKTYKKVALSKRNIFNPNLRSNEYTQVSMRLEETYFKGPYHFKGNWVNLNSLYM